ncbi:MAG: PhzF family phenazine biosynthesis isomerase [Pseudomonadota bacterium]
MTYSIVDVFTRKRFAGNPVAVIHDARVLSPEEMQNVACEFGFSETTFILPPASDAHAAQVRIFTPSTEIPFAGHPNIGTAFVMGREVTAAVQPLPREAVFDEMGGDVSVWPTWEDGTVVGAEIEAPQALERLGPVDPQMVARCLGLSKGQIGNTRLPPIVASVGLPFAFVELDSADALASVTCDVQAFKEAAAKGPQTVDDFAICAFVVVESKGAEIAVQSRVLSPSGPSARGSSDG